VETALTQLPPKAFVYANKLAFFLDSQRKAQTIISKMVDLDRHSRHRHKSQGVASPPLAGSLSRDSHIQLNICGSQKNWPGEVCQTYHVVILPYPLAREQLCDPLFQRQFSEDDSG
jgi:hypothetical protein